MASLDFSVEEEVDRILDIFERACERFGVEDPPHPRKDKCELEATEEGVANGVLRQNV